MLQSPFKIVQYLVYSSTCAACIALMWIKCRIKCSMGSGVKQESIKTIKGNEDKCIYNIIPNFISFL